MTSLLITIDLNGQVRALELARSDTGREMTDWLMSVVEPQLRPIRELGRVALATPKSHDA
jgi:hypothetical protein